MSSLGSIPVTDVYWNFSNVGNGYYFEGEVEHYGPYPPHYDLNGCLNTGCNYGDISLIVNGSWADSARPTTITITGFFYETGTIDVYNTNSDAVGSAIVYGNSSPFVINITSCDYPIGEIYFNDITQYIENGPPPYYEDYGICSIVFGENCQTEPDCCWTNKVRTAEPGCA